MTQAEFEHTVEDMAAHIAAPERIREAARWMNEHPWSEEDHPDRIGGDT